VPDITRRITVEMFKEMEKRGVIEKLLTKERRGLSSNYTKYVITDAGYAYLIENA
jgi:hypothetical protein